MANFAALAIYSRLLSPDGYGRYAIVIALVSLAGVIVFQWQRLVLQRWLPARKTDPDRFLGEALYVFGGLTLGVSLIGALAAALWADPEWRSLVALAVPLLVAQNWLELNLGLATAHLRPGRYGLLSGGKSLVAVLIGGWLAWVGLGAMAPMLGLLLGSLASAAFFGIGAWRCARIRRPDAADFRRQLAFGLPLTVTFALAWIVSSSDRLLLGWLMDVDAAAVYSVGYDLAQNTLGILLGILNLAAYPLAVKTLEQSGTEAAVGQIRNNAELMSSAALAGAAGLAVLAPQLAGVVLGSQFRDGATAVLPVIAVAAAVLGIKAFHFDLAFHLGQSTLGLIRSGVLAALANLGLNLVLIPRVGILGAAYATLIALLIGTVASARLGRRLFPLPRFLPILTRAVMVAAAAAVGAAVGSAMGNGLSALVPGLIAGASLAACAAVVLDIAGLRRSLIGWVRRIRTT
jgi:O-antigen/teichoic acid export membrane protein